jgi:urease accessory protein
MNSPNRNASRTLATLMLGALTPVAALAHPGHPEAGTGFMAGLLHPLGGLDHVLMIVAVSLWATQLKPAGRLVVAASLGLFVAIGALLPVAPLAGADLEIAIALTVIGAGMLLAMGRRWPAWATASFAALFALIHGFAHGAEGPAASPLYVPGLFVATAGLALVVSFLAARLQAQRGWLRVAGAMGAISGAVALLNAS